MKTPAAKQLHKLKKGKFWQFVEDGARSFMEDDDDNNVFRRPRQAIRVKGIKLQPIKTVNTKIELNISAKTKSISETSLLQV